MPPIQNDCFLDLGYDFDYILQSLPDGHFICFFLGDFVKKIMMKCYPIRRPNFLVAIQMWQVRFRIPFLPIVHF